MALAPAHVAALGLAAFGLGLIAAAFLGESLGWIRLAVGIALVEAAMLTSGLHVLNRHGGSFRGEA